MTDYEHEIETVANFANISHETARKFLTKYNGNLEKAIDGALNANRDDEQDVDMPPPLIDPATDPDDEYQRALQLSMEPKLVPSERAPHPDWQLVRTNTPVNNPLSPDEALRQALRASLEEVTSDEGLPLEESARGPGRPVVLRADSPSLAYAALLIHALFHVPQIRKHVANIPLPQNQESDPATWKLIEIFTSLDLAQTSVVHESTKIEALSLAPLPDLSDHPGSVASNAYIQLARLIDNSPLPTQMRICHYTSESLRLHDGTLTTSDMIQQSCIVNTELYKDPKEYPSNDLVSQLSASVLREDRFDVIAVPSEVILFNVRPPDRDVSQTEEARLKYPKSIHLDQFMAENVTVSMQKRRTQQQTQQDMQKLQKRLASITRHKNQDTIKDLETAIHYYEDLASGRDNPERLAAITRTLGKLQALQSKLTEEVKVIETELSRLQNSVDAAFDSLDLQQHPYDLRGVLMYTGVAGRKNIYSYVKSLNGIWWKTVDRSVVEVPEETVLNDSAGHRLGAGPFMLIYSRTTVEDTTPLQWPSVFADDVAANNRRFLESLPPVLEKVGR